MGLDVNNEFNISAMRGLFSLSNIKNFLSHSTMNVQSIFSEYAGSDGKLDRSEVEKCISIWNMSGVFDTEQIFQAIDGCNGEAADDFITLDEVKSYAGSLDVNISDNDTLLQVLLNVASKGGGLGNVIAQNLNGNSGGEENTDAANTDETIRRPDLGV